MKFLSKHTCVYGVMLFCCVMPFTYSIKDLFADVPEAKSAAKVETSAQGEEKIPFLRESQIKGLPSLEEITSVIIARIKPAKSVRSNTDVKVMGQPKELSDTDLALFKGIFGNDGNFRFTIKKKCLFVAEFMVSFPQHSDLFLFVSLSTNQIQVLSGTAYQIFDLSTPFESSDQLSVFKDLFH